jgi:hypothetical protein
LIINIKNMFISIKNNKKYKKQLDFIRVFMIYYTNGDLREISRQC